MFYYYLILILWLCILLENLTDAVLSTDCQIITDRSYQPNMTYSFLGTLKLLSKSKPTVIDCAHLCLESNRCQTAVFEEIGLTCKLYSEIALSSGRLVANSTGRFSTIITEKPLPDLIYIPPTVTIFPIWNTTAGQNSIPATSGIGIGQYYFLYPPANLFDGNWLSSFCSYGISNASTYSVRAGVDTGVYVTLPESSVILKGFRFVKGGYTSQRDPMKLTIEGSNQTVAALTLGASWTLIYNDTAGFDINPDFLKPGSKQILSDNTLSFSNYRFLMTQIRGSASCVEYTEIELYRR